MNKVFVLLSCFYEGDGYLIDDSFVAVAHSVELLTAHAKSKFPNCEVFLPGQDVPDDCGYGNKRFRIIETGVLTT